MFTFFVCLALLLIGYATYGAFVEKVFHPDDRETPCTRLEDGIDYTPIAPWRAFLIQLLNIAGLGPIFGALSGAIWGPSVMLWIVFGTIFAGAVHDFLSGMLSMRNDGASISEITGIYLGRGIYGRAGRTDCSSDSRLAEREILDYRNPDLLLCCNLTAD